MKKAIILLGFIGFSAVCFSQTATVNKNSAITANAKKVAVDKTGLKPIVIGEKIQITEGGVVRFSKPYTPKYPTHMTGPDTQPIKKANTTNTNTTQTN